MVTESNRYRQKTWDEKLKEAEALEKILKPKAKEQQGMRTDLCLNLDKCSTPIDVKKETAEALNTSHGTLYKAKIIAKENPEAIKKIDAGFSTVHREFKKIKFNEAIKIVSKPVTPEGVYDVIVIDPPWNYGTKYDPETRRVSCLFCEVAWFT